MAKVKTYDPHTFEEKEIEIDDFHMELGNTIKSALEVLEPTPLIFLENKVCVGIFKPTPSKRKVGEEFTKYRIVIEKV